MKEKQNMPIESLIHGISLFSRHRAWCPIKIDKIESLIKFDHNDEECYYLDKQFQYGIQYLEFQEKIINEMFLTGNLPQMSYKFYIINAVSIVEGIFYYQLKKRGVSKYQNYKFSKMITEMEENNFLNYHEKLFSALRFLNVFRNDVHNFIKARNKTSDYYLGHETYLLAKHTLNGVLNKLYTSKENVFNFLILNDNEKRKLERFINIKKIL